MRQNPRYSRQYGGTKGMSVRSEVVWFQGVLFFLLYRQCADTIKGRELLPLSTETAKTKSGKKQRN